MVTLIRYGCLIMSIFLCAAGSHAAVTARVDRDTVQITDSFSLILETDQSVSDPPDFSPLREDFDILGTSQSTNINLINGKMRRSARWVIELMAKREGELTVPAVIVGREFTEPVEITVEPADTIPADSRDVQLEVEVDNRTPYVQGQIIYTVRLMHRVQIDNASLTEPRVTGADVVIERLGDDVVYETRRDGNRIAVVERRYAMFPQSSTRFTIEPLLLEGRIADNRSFGFGFGGRGRVFRVRSDAIEVEARPVPPGFSGSSWLPAGRLLLSETAPDSNQRYRAGEPFTRTLTLQATGLSSSQLPEIGASAPAGIKQYPDQPVLENRFEDDGLVAVRQEKIALIPSAAGTYTLPAIEIPWWNTQTDGMEVARLPARTIEVMPVPGAADRQPPSASVASGAPPADAIGVPSAPAPASGSVRSVSPNVWAWLSLLLAIGWLATALGWYRSRKAGVSKPAPHRAPPSQKQLTVAVNTACSSNDANAAKQALLNWAAQQWPGIGIRSLGDLAARLDGDLQQQIHRLSRALYGTNHRGWQDGALLWRAFEARQGAHSAKKSAPGPELEPLYLR